MRPALALIIGSTWNRWQLDPKAEKFPAFWSKYIDKYINKQTTTLVIARLMANFY